tara:strand:- start:22870 stop:23469 length:600 start_codon:yes stop_codon:yes gene_type:complete
MTTEEETTDDQPKDETEAPSFDAVDLMLEGNLKEQISYSMVKALAKALDEKAQILIQAEHGFEPQEEESFAEVAMPEIEAMAQAVTGGCVDFSKIRFWEACETAEVAWEESKDEEGKVVGRMPYGNPHDKPRDGNRILANLEQISKWLGQVHELHLERGMGWVSPYGCPEDGQQAYDDRAKCFEKLQATVEAIQNNLDI